MLSHDVFQELIGILSEAHFQTRQLRRGRRPAGFLPVAGGTGDAMVGAALAQCSGAARSAIERAARGERKRGDANGPGSVLIALQNAFYQLVRAPGFEPALIETVGACGEADASGAIAGALLGALYGRDTLPARWLLPLLACRPDAEAGAPQPRRMAYWPDDVLDLAESLTAA